MRVGFLALVLLVGSTSRAAGSEWQIKPWVGLTFGGGTTFTGDFDHAAGQRKVAVGVSGEWLSEVFGAEVDVGRTPGFFESNDLPLGTQSLVLSSAVTTVTGNLVVALPRHWVEYTLRPYVVGGGGLMRARATDRLGLLPIDSDLAAIDVGGGRHRPFDEPDRIELGREILPQRRRAGEHRLRHRRGAAVILAGDHGARDSILRQSRR